MKKYGDSPCLGKRDGTGPYTFETYAQIGKKVDDIGSAMASKGIQAKSAVGVYGANCPEWMVTMQVSHTVWENCGLLTCIICCRRC